MTAQSSMSREANVPFPPLGCREREMTSPVLATQDRNLLGSIAMVRSGTLFESVG